jgi:methylase of polypeptide subunit release factors
VSNQASASAPAAGLDHALQSLLRWLKNARYEFVTPTPTTHARILARGEEAGDLRDAFGWNRPFRAEILEAGLLRELLAADLIRREGELFRSHVRVSSLRGDLFTHSGFPTTERDAVFLGPDSYRFAELIAQELAQCPPANNARLIDIGTGAGVGAIVAARCCPKLTLALTDINPRALAFARINAAVAGVRASFFLSDSLDVVERPVDVILANPPFIMDESGRDYRHGGDMHGAAVAFAMAQAATARLGPGGRFILYTGSAILKGADPLRERLSALAQTRGYSLRYREIDPDIFGEELDKPAYADVERIALVAAVMDRQ